FRTGQSSETPGEFPAVRLDRLEQLEISSRIGERDVKVGPHQLEATFLHPHPTQFGMHQLWDVDVRRQAIVGRQMHDLRLDELLAALVGECDPMVAVGDEVGAAYLEDR